jgi:hypothetical protein
MRRRTVLVLIAGLLALNAHAGAPPGADFSGAWRLDDRNSDNATTLAAALRDEAHKEQQASTQNTQGTTSPATGSSGSNAGGGHHGGAGAGGMGHGGGMGGSGGGHSRHGGGDTSNKDNASKDGDAGTYPLPPTLSADSVLLVQQDAKTVDVHLGNGDRLTATLDGQPHQSLNGNAMVRGHLEAGHMEVAIEYADGTQLVQNWAWSPDGQQLVVTGSWKLPTLQAPVSFRRTYVGLH